MVYLTLKTIFGTNFTAINYQKGFFNTFENKQFQIRCRFFFGHVVYVRD